MSFYPLACEIQTQDQQSHQEGGGQSQNAEDFVDGCPVFEASYEDNVEAYPDDGAGCVGDEIGDIEGSQGEHQLAELDGEADGCSVQERFFTGGIQHFQVHAEREKQKDVQQDFPDMKEGADIAGIIKWNEIEPARADEGGDVLETERHFENGAPDD